MEAISWKSVAGSLMSKTNMAPENGPLQKIPIIETIIFRVHVGFLGCIHHDLHDNLAQINVTMGKPNQIPLKCQ